MGGEAKAVLPLGEVSWPWEWGAHCARGREPLLGHCFQGGTMLKAPWEGAPCVCHWRDPSVRPWVGIFDPQSCLKCSTYSRASIGLGHYLMSNGNGCSSKGSSVLQELETQCLTNAPSQAMVPGPHFAHPSHAAALQTGVLPLPAPPSLILTGSIN